MNGDSQHENGCTAYTQNCQLFYKIYNSFLSPVLLLIFYTITLFNSLFPLNMKFELLLQ